MPSRLDTINDNLELFDSLAPYELEPFMEMPAFGDDPFWGKSENTPQDKDLTLIISGPSRNGNHLIHSMLDNHPQLPQAPGEDSFLAAFFNEARKDPNEARRQLQGKDNLEYILQLSGMGCNKWREFGTLAKDSTNYKSDVWAGIQGDKNFVTDYQDTVVEIDYPAYETRLKEILNTIRTAPTLMDIIQLYLDALVLLGPQPQDTQYRRILVGSGMRAECNFLFERSPDYRCITPIRSFDSYYFSFAKGWYQVEEIKPEIIQEAWEHWWHKAVDYLLLKRMYPDKICLVNYENVIKDGEKTAKNICHFLGIPPSATCLSPTTFGKEVKGNSSFPKDEKCRGKFYSDGLKKRLPEYLWPDLYPALWRMVKELSL